MAIFQCIKGDRIENSIRYKLLELTDAGNKEVATQELIQTFDIPGAISTTGKPYEYGDNVQLDKYGYNCTPITKETGEGFVYYFRFEGSMDVLSTEYASFTNVNYSGVLYIDEYAETRLKVSSEGFVGDYGEGEGIYLNVYINDSTTVAKVKVFDLSDTSHKVVSVNITSVTIFRTAEYYHRTTYIPIDCLTNTDKLEGGCVGFYNSFHTDVPIYKMSFYDKDFDFLGGVSYGTILNKYGNPTTADAVGYLTVEQVKELANSNSAKYVIFTSSYSSTDTKIDQVSIGGIYFPLFAYGSDVFAETQSHSLVVRAIADGIFFTDSEYSTAVTYIRTGS